MSDTSSALADASIWVEHVMLGQTATALATICTALLGVACLSGRVATKRVAAVVTGCFIIFGASVIANALVGLAGSPQLTQYEASTMPAYLPKSQPAVPYDPYSGASVPQSLQAPNSIPTLR